MWRALKLLTLSNPDPSGRRVIKLWYHM